MDTLGGVVNSPGTRRQYLDDAGRSLMPCGKRGPYRVGLWRSYQVPDPAISTGVRPATLPATRSRNRSGDRQRVHDSGIPTSRCVIICSLCMEPPNGGVGMLVLGSIGFGLVIGWVLSARQRAGIAALLGVPLAVAAGGMLGGARTAVPAAMGVLLGGAGIRLLQLFGSRSEQTSLERP